MGTTCSHKPSHIKATDFLVQEHLTWNSHDQETCGKHTVLATALVNMQEFYAAVEHVKADGTREVWCAVLKVTWRPKEEYNCCVKDMSEHDGPYYYNCPEKILKLLTPTDSEYALEWRAKCWTKGLNRQIVKKVGDKVRLWGRVYVLEEDLGRKGFYAIQEDSGLLYRLKLNQVKEAVLVEDSE